MSNAKALNQVVPITWEDKDPSPALLSRRRTSKYQLLYDAIDDMGLNKWRRFEMPGDAMRKVYNSLTTYVSDKRKLRYNIRADKSKLLEGVGVIYLRLLGPK